MSAVLQKAHNSEAGLPLLGEGQGGVKAVCGWLQNSCSRQVENCKHACMRDTYVQNTCILSQPAPVTTNPVWVEAQEGHP